GRPLADRGTVARAERADGEGGGQPHAPRAAARRALRRALRRHLRVRPRRDGPAHAQRAASEPARSMSSPAALLVFAKLPEPGAVKTRLTTLLTHAEAAALSEAFLRDSLDAYGALPADVRLYVDAPPETVPSGLAPDGVSLH